MDNENDFNLSTDNSFKKSKVKYSSGGGFGKTVFVPFISGIAGATLVIGTCFGVPSVKSKLLQTSNQGTFPVSASSSDSEIGRAHV